MAVATQPQSFARQGADDPLPLVSIVLAVRNESRGLPDVLDTVFRQDYPTERLEVIVVDGASEDDSAAIVERYVREHPHLNVRMVSNPRRITPCAFNTGIRAARGEIVAIFGAHSIYRPDYIRRSVEILQRGGDGVACAGGLNNIIPGGDSVRARAIAHVLTHPAGRGGSPQRITDAADIDVSGIGYPVWRRSVFDRVGYYDERLLRNQDNEFNARVIEAGYRIVCSRRTNADRRARSDVRGLARWAYDYGYYHFPVVRIRPSAFRLKYYLPAILLLGLAVTGLAGLFWRSAAMLFAAGAGAYLILTLGAATHIALTRPGGWKCLLVLPLLFTVFHFAYGWGVIRGFFSPLGKRNGQSAGTAPVR
jgi:glycosyltransferase involved in cell wall biosynthesis